MSAKHDQLVTLSVLDNEIEAQLLVNLLKENGIAAVATGGVTSAFRAEAPGDVRVLIKQDCLSQARSVLAEFELETAPTRTDEKVESEDYVSSLTRFGIWSWLVIALIGILVSFVFWAAGETSTAALVVGLVISIALIRIIAERLTRSGH